MNDDTNDVRAALATLTRDVDVPPTLVERGLRHGKRLRTRRRVVVATSVAASAALVAGVTGLAGGLGGRAMPGDVASGGGDVVYRSTDDPKFHVLARQEDQGERPAMVSVHGDVCFAAVDTNDPVKPSTWTCWDPPGMSDVNTDGIVTTIPGTMQSVPLSHGWSVAAESVKGDVRLMAFRPPGGGPTEYVPTVEVELAPGYRFAFAAYQGSDRLRGRFVPVERSSCAPGARAGYDQQPDDQQLYQENALAALDALVGTTAVTPGPGLPPRTGYRPAGSTADVTTFRHDGVAGGPPYEVDVFRRSATEYAALLVVECTD